MKKKKRYDKNENKKVSLKDFAPYDYGETHETAKLIYNCVLDKNIKNIGITGNFGSGKSTIIKNFVNSYSKKPETKRIHNKDKKLKLIKISFGNLVSNEILDSQDVTNAIMANFVFMNSNIKKFVYKIVCIILFAISVFLYYSNKIDNYLVNLWHDININTVKIVESSIMVILFCLLIVAFSPFIKNIRIHWVSSKTEIEYEDKNSVIFPDLEGIKKFFLSEKIDVVIFEDLDRCDNYDIFDKLRELNFMLNNIKKRKVTFIYAMSNTIFGDETVKSKFLDIDIPVYPYVSSTTSINVFEDYFNNEKGKRISEDFLRKVSSYIYDNRIINDIYNHYQMIINSSINEYDKSNYEKILAISIFMSLFPNEYQLVQTKSSVLDVFFDKFIETKEKINQLKNNEIFKYKILSKLCELKYQMILDLRKNKKFAQIEDFDLGGYSRHRDYPALFKEYRLEKIDTFYVKELNETYKFRDFLDYEKYCNLESDIINEGILSQFPINGKVSDYLNKYKDISIFNVIKNLAQLDSKHIKLTEEKQNLLITLLENDYIQEDFIYYFYISSGTYIPVKDLVVLNEINIKANKNCKPYDFLSPERIIFQIKNIEVLTYEKYFNYSLINELLTNSDKRIVAKKNNFFSKLDIDKNILNCFFMLIRKFPDCRNEAIINLLNYKKSLFLKVLYDNYNEFELDCKGIISIICQNFTNEILKNNDTKKYIELLVNQYNNWGNEILESDISNVLMAEGFIFEKLSLINKKHLERIISKSAFSFTKENFDSIIEFYSAPKNLLKELKDKHILHYDSFSNNIEFVKSFVNYCVEEDYTDLKRFLTDNKDNLKSIDKPEEYDFISNCKYFIEDILDDDIDLNIFYNKKIITEGKFKITADNLFKLYRNNIYINHISYEDNVLTNFDCSNVNKVEFVLSFNRDALQKLSSKQIGQILNLKLTNELAFTVYNKLPLRFEEKIIYLCSQEVDISILKKDEIQKDFSMFIDLHCRFLKNGSFSFDREDLIMILAFECLVKNGMVKEIDKNEKSKKIRFEYI